MLPAVRGVMLCIVFLCSRVVFFFPRRPKPLAFLLYFPIFAAVNSVSLPYLPCTISAVIPRSALFVEPCVLFSHFYVATLEV